MWFGRYSAMILFRYTFTSECNVWIIISVLHKARLVRVDCIETCRCEKHVSCCIVGCGLSLRRRRVWITAECLASGSFCCRKRCSTRTTDCLSTRPCKSNVLNGYWPIRGRPKVGRKSRITFGRNRMCHRK